MRSRRGSVHGRLAALEAKADARHVVPVVVAHIDGRVDGVGNQTWPSLDAMRADLSQRQKKLPLVIQLAVDPLVVSPEESE